MTLEARHAILDALQAIVGEEYALAVMEHRKAKKCPLTPLAARILAKQFALCPDPKAAVEEMLNRGWTGFKAEWMRKAAKSTGRRTVFDVAMEKFNGSEAYLAVVGMLNSFPASGNNPDLTMGTYQQVLQGLSPQAVIEASQRFVMGDVEGQSKTFAPSIAEFVTEARKRQEFIGLKAKPRLPAPRYFPGPLAPFQVRQQKRLSENANRPVIAENINFDQWRRMSQAKEVPAGAIWVATLGIVFGPPKANSQAS